MADGLKITKDTAGTRRALGTGVLLVVGAIVGVVAALWLFGGGAIDEDGARRGADVAVVETVAAPPPAEKPVIRSQPAGVPRAVKPDSAEVDKEPEIAAGEYIEALRAAGETGGIAAFNPPGTDPIKSGIIVPDDYELPVGYARRYQTTDDGQQLPAILAFSPDFDLVGADGKPIPLPEDGIVPPDMAPPGLPIRMLRPGKRAGR